MHSSATSMCTAVTIPGMTVHVRRNTHRQLEACLKQAFGTTDEGDNALTIKDALLSLSRMCFQRHETAGQEFLKLPRPDEKQEAIFKALGVLPPRSRVQKPATL